MLDTVFRFAQPHFFYYLLLVPVFIFLYFLFDKKRKNIVEKLIGTKVLAQLTQSLSLTKRKWKRILQVVVLVLFVFSLAQPQNGKSEQKVKSEGIELIFLVDVSNSMLTEDVKPSRLDLAKKELIRFLDLSTGDRVGLIAFAGSAVLLSPMTQDRSALMMYINSLSPDTVSTQGTQFRKALAEAKEAFTRGGVEEDEKTSVTRAIIIISDGEDNEQGAIEAAQELLKDDVRIFSLAVGTEKGGAIPIRNVRGELKGYRKDRSSQVVLSKTKGTILKKLAAEGKGSFYHLTIGSTVMNNLVKDIRNLEKSEFDNSVVTQYNENYQWVLFFAILFLFIEILLSERKTKGRIWQGRFEVMEN
ncbi:MAG: VWA domain-containing protein [Bdellovibrionaceae bacterium]|jgi:Ca-activated chloride channel homolog|nr:VWA domain-containing protein [Pseudobdellovibrionaceae bacterium]